MRGKKKENKKLPEKQIDSQVERPFVLMDNRRIRFLIAGAVLLLFTIYYWSHNLFDAYNHNDFGEYYNRAQDWVDGHLSTSGGSDLLLSVIEYVGIYFHPHDFLASYRLASRILIVVLMLSSFVFVVRRNSILPDFWIKLSTVALALSIPHFILATVTIDQTLLFGACMLLFLATYNIPWAGFVAVLTFFSRPEAVIILPMYLLLFLLDKTHRKYIAINAASFLILLISLKFFLSPDTEGIKAVTAYREYSYLERINWTFFKGILLRIPRTPIAFIRYAYEALQNNFQWLLFIVGLVFAVRERKAWPFYGLMVFFFFAYLVQAAHAPLKPFAQFFSVIADMQQEEDYFIVKAFNKFDRLVGHGRYRLVLYPAFAFFVIQGLFISISSLLQLFRKKRYLPHLSLAIACFTTTMVWYNTAVRFRPIAREYNLERKLNRMHPVYKMGMELRKHEANGAIFIDNFCDETDGALLSIFSAYSGCDSVLTRFCKFGIWYRDETGRRVLLKVKDYEKMTSANPQLLAMYERSTADIIQLTDTNFINRWEKIAFTYNDSLMQFENITHVLAARKISFSHLELIDSVPGGGYIHRRISY